MKKFVSLLLCAALIFTITGCTGKPEETLANTDPTEPSAIEVPIVPEKTDKKYEGVQLRFLTLLDENDPQAEVIRQAVRTFEIQTGANVAVYWFSGNLDVMLANFSEGAVFDIFGTAGEMLQSDFLEYTLDLTELAQQADYEKHSYTVLRDQVVKRCGFLAGIPQIPYLYGVYYNREYFSQCDAAVPDSWEEFLTVSQQMKDKGFEPLTMDGIRTDLVLELHLQRGLGEARLDELVLKGGWSKDTAVVDLLQQAIDYADEGLLAKYSPDTYPNGQNRLAMSNVVMTVGDNTLCSEVERDSFIDLSWGVFPYPGDSDSPGVFVDADVLCIHKDSANAQAAFDFIMLLSCGEFDQLRADIYGGIPADPSNECDIEGAKACLREANPRSPGRFSVDNLELFTRLWNGWYKTARYFANALEGISG